DAHHQVLRKQDNERNEEESNDGHKMETYVFNWAELNIRLRQLDTHFLTHWAVFDGRVEPLAERTPFLLFRSFSELVFLWHLQKRCIPRTLEALQTFFNNVFFRTHTANADNQHDERDETGNSNHHNGVYV